MRITKIKGTNIDLTPAIENYVEEKLRPVAKLVQELGEAVSVDVEVGKSTKHHNKGPYFVAEFVLQVPGEVLRAREERDQLYEAIDVAASQLRRQAKNHKDYLKERNIAPRPDKE